jgi:large subunit ribosomal protein L24
MARHVRKGDQVVVTAGDDKGRVGTVLRVIPEDDRVVVQGVNMHVKHLKPTQTRAGGMVRRESPIHISNVSPVADGKPTRVRFVSRPDGTKSRIAARSGKELHALRGKAKG